MIGRLSKGIFFLLDILLINMAFLLALVLRFDGDIEPRYITLYKEKWILITCVMLVVFFCFNLYNSLWRYASIKELLQIVSSCLLGSCILVAIGFWEKTLFPRSSYIIYIFTLTFVTVGTRFSYRLLRKIIKNSTQYAKYFAKSNLIKPKKRIMLVGAGEAASLIIKDMNKNIYSNKEIILLVDDDKNKWHVKLNGVPVKGDTMMIPELASAYAIEEIIVAMPSASKKRIAQILAICNETSCNLKIFPGIAKAIEGSKASFIRPVKIEDLLGRQEITLDNHHLSNILKEKVILITGGGGSIGSELCRQVVNFEPSKVIVFDIYENNAYDLQMELIQNGISRETLHIVIGSVRDKEKLEEVFDKYKPNIVFHAAAHKHVPLMEENPEEAIKNNVFGTLNVAQCARKYRTQKFVLVSTDKAVNPANVMGATKRICEMIVQSINTVSENTDFVAVRFGNVLGSNGSVIPLFKRQLDAGGPLTVTHPEIIRYFMTIPEAVRLILEATTFATGGEIFVLDMGEPVKILDLAKNFIKLSGFELGKDIEIKFTGLRPGEKLYEELLMAEEGLQKTSSDKIFIAAPNSIPYTKLIQTLNYLNQEMEQGRNIKELLIEIVPTYVAYSA